LNPAPSLPPVRTMPCCPPVSVNIVILVCEILARKKKKKKTSKTSKTSPASPFVLSLSSQMKPNARQQIVTQVLKDSSKDIRIRAPRPDEPGPTEEEKRHKLEEVKIIIINNNKKTLRQQFFFHSLFLSLSFSLSNTSSFHLRRSLPVIHQSFLVRPPLLLLIVSSPHSRSC